MEITTLKKATEVVHVGNRLSLVERKVWNVLLHNAYANLLKKQTHSVTIREICRMCGFDTNNLDPLKEALRRLRRTDIEWVELAGVNDKSGTWTNIGFLSGSRIRRGRLEYSFDPFLRELLYHPKVFVLLMMEVQRQFRGSYSLILYEICKRFERIRTTGFIELEKWRELLGVADMPYYETFNRFKTKIIVPAVKEINDVSDIKVKPEYKRESRYVTAIRFRIQPNKQPPLFNVDGTKELPRDTTEEGYNEIMETLTTEEIERLRASFEQNEIAQNTFLQERFAKNGFENPTIHTLFQSYVVQQVQERALNTPEEGQ